MLILRLDYAGMISAVIAITALIPILGAYIGGGVGFILLFMVSPKKAVIFVVFLLILQEIENKFDNIRIRLTDIGGDRTEHIIYDKSGIYGAHARLYAFNYKISITGRL